MRSSFLLQAATSEGQRVLVSLDNLAFAADGGRGITLVGLVGGERLTLKTSFAEFERVVESLQAPPPGKTAPAAVPLASDPRPLPRMVDGFPRRLRLDHFTPVETLIRTAEAAIEGAGCDERLTNAGTLLAQGRSLVADYYEDVPLAPARPEIVCLCGSTRFIDAFREHNLRLTLEGKIVLSIGCDTKSDQGLGLDAAAKERLDALHLRKIDLADRVLVLNVGDYIGESTQREIAYALAHGKPIDYLEARRP